MSKFTTFVFVLAALAAQAATGQDRPAPDRGVTTSPVEALGSKAPFSLVYDHVSGATTLRNPKGEIVETWDRYTSAAPLASIPPDRPLSIIIDNANPLLYDYQVDATVVGREDPKLCSQVGGRFFTQGLTLGAAGVVTGMARTRGGSQQATSGGGFVDIPSLFSNLFNAGTRGSSSLSEEALETQLSVIRADVNSFIGFADQIAMLNESVDDSLSYFAARAESQSLASMIESYERALESIEPGLSNPSQTPLIVDSRVRRLAPSVARLKSLSSAVTRGDYQGSSDDMVVRETLQLADKVESAGATLSVSYVQLQANLLTLDRIKSQTRRVFSLGAGDGAIRRIAIRSESNGQRPEVMRLHEGEREVYTRPRTRITCELSLGVAWVNPGGDYAINSADSTVTNLNKDDFRLAPSVLLHVSSSAAPFLGITGGLGVGANKAPDLYLGGTMRLFAPIMVNFGWTWQRQEQLPENLSLGTSINPRSTALNDLPRSYTRSFYVGVSFAR